MTDQLLDSNNIVKAMRQVIDDYEACKSKKPFLDEQSYMKRGTKKEWSRELMQLVKEYGLAVHIEGGAERPRQLKRIKNWIDAGWERYD